MFKALGLLVALYAFYAAMTGSVYAKSGPGGRRISKQDTPRYFWTVITTYLVLSIMLFFFF